MTSRDALADRYRRIDGQLAGLFAKYGAAADLEARLATAVAVLHHKMPHFFWTGVYRLVGDDLVVGPYQGPLACAVLERGKGVCRACVERRETIVVPDVHAFADHIACDPRSRSEIVVPIIRDGAVLGVLDVDSDRPEAFGAVDAEGLERIVATVLGA
ncbi:MAG: GAF domain-containing protein [Acidobacteriota bacterium]|nr:MAG: GAF domain-containing protein [Acidobacteriota bacterium]